MTPLDQLEDLLDHRTCAPEDVCSHVAALFDLQASDIGLLLREGDHLYFLHPAELRVAGTIPLTSNAVAARTATTRVAEIFNRFVQVPHHTVFETVKIGRPSTPAPDAPSVIQKLISTPLIGYEDECLGVLQVCRKGTNPFSAGPDFTPEDLSLLQRAARRVAILVPQMLAARQPGRSILRFSNAAVPNPLRSSR